MFIDTIPSALVSFALVAGLVTITPGLDTALVLRSALTKGRASAYATALGVCTGCLVWGVAAAVGVSAVLTAWRCCRKFIPTDASPVLMGALLAVVHSIEGILWFTLIIAGAHAMRAWLRRSRVQRG
jgi:threonine/homoserine/homoserine lactone efflux protein